MPNCAPTQVVDIMEETARLSYQARLTLPGCGRWRDFRWLGQTGGESCGDYLAPETVERMSARTENGTARER